MKVMLLSENKKKRTACLVCVINGKSITLHVVNVYKNTCTHKNTKLFVDFDYLRSNKWLEL